MSYQVWKIYVPHELFQQRSSTLYGHVIPDSQSAYITASSDSPTLANELIPELQIIGFWSAEDNKCTNKLKKQYGKRKVWISVYISNNGDICCDIVDHGTAGICTCILYKPMEFMKSELLRQKALAETECHDAVTSLVKVLLDTNVSLSDKEITSDLRVYTRGTSKRKWRTGLLSMLVLIVNIMYKPFCWMPFKSNNGDQEKKSYRKKVVDASATMSQLEARTVALNHLREQKKLKDWKYLSCVNQIVIQLVDSALGVTLMYFLMSDNTAQNVANICLAYGDKVAGELKVLLDWLMGAPAGLKLNSQLTHILGKFFQYHIYLWTGYLYILKPVLGQLVYYSSVAGIWGLSVQLAMFQDILSTMTIHIYCFYVYAARLYRLQMYVLGSLWRLFRGKKWNVLRERVDSAVYDVNQLFVGTLLFTVLLFLLPTTGLYYFVFTMLRVVVLTVQGLLTRARHLHSTLPWWYWLLWIGNSATIRDGAVFQVVPTEKTSSSSALVLTLQTVKPSFSEVLLYLYTPVKSSTAAYSWGTILKSLFLGHLIYPWIDKKRC